MLGTQMLEPTCFGDVTDACRSGAAAMVVSTARRDGAAAAASAGSADGAAGASAEIAPAGSSSASLSSLSLSDRLSANSLARFTGPCWGKIHYFSTGIWSGRYPPACKGTCKVKVCYLPEGKPPAMCRANAPPVLQ